MTEYTPTKAAIMWHEGMKKVCPECDGEGRLEYGKPVIDYVNGGYIDTVWDDCDECHGAGEVDFCEDELKEDDEGNLWIEDEIQF